MQYALAAALLDHELGLDTFSDDQVLRPEAQALIPRVKMRRIAGYEGRPSWTEAYNEVEVHLHDGRVLRERADRPTEGALRGVTMQDVHKKFEDCASRVLSPGATNELAKMLDKLEDSESIGRITAILRNDGSDRHRILSTIDS